MKSELVRGPASANTNLTQFQRKIEEKYGIKFSTYWELHRWSLENTTKFWTEIWDFLNIVCSEPFTTVMEPDKRFEDIPQWFLGAKLNYAENMLRHQDGDMALILSGEDRDDEVVTFGQLREEVSLMSSAFRNVGIKKGDVVASYMSNRKEPIVELLAAASIGALFAAVNPQMGVKATTSRLHQLSPKVLISTDRHLYAMEEKDVLSVLPAIVKGLPTLEHVVIVPSKTDSLQKEISSIPHSIFYPDFLRKGLDADGRVPLPRYEQLSFNHPLTINFTSGTTGNPKAIVHSAGAALLGPLKENVLGLNAKKSECRHTVLATGWVSWSFAVTALAAGAPLLIYEGNLFYHDSARYCDLFNRYKVTFAFFPPSILEDMMRSDLIPGPESQLESLHTIAAGSAFVKGYLFDFVHNKIKSDVFFSILYGSTEYMMLIAGMNHTLPVYKEEIQVPFLGLDIQCYNDAGISVLDQKGEVVICKPYPNMPRFIWNDDGMKKYRSSFFSKFPGVWCQGDICSINSCTKGMTVYGRSDETIKQRGVRFGSSEIYSIINPLEIIGDSLCVSWINKEGDEIGMLFVQAKGGNVFTSEDIGELRRAIADELGEEYVPEKIFQVKDVPYNVNGKKMEILVKKILAKTENLSYDAVVNPECLEEYMTISQRLQQMS